MFFKVIIQNISGTEKWEIPIDGWSFTEELNRDKSATFNISDETVQYIADVFNLTNEYIFSASYREAYIFDEDDVRIYGGYIAEPSVNKGSDGVKTRTITSKGFFSLLAKRFTNKPPDYKRVYEAEYATDIAWDLIQYTQGLPFGDLLITRGAHPNDELNDRTLKFRTIKEAIEKLDNNNTTGGIDHEITPDKVFNTFYPQKGSQRLGFKLVDGFNINSYSIRKNFIDAMANQVIVFGEGQDELMATSLQDSEDEFKENFFLLQEGLSEKDTKIQDNLDRKGEKYIETYKAPTLGITITTDYSNPLFTEYEVGDSIKIEIPEESVNDFYRLRQKTLNSDGEVTLSFIPS